MSASLLGTVVIFKVKSLWRTQTFLKSYRIFKQCNIILSKYILMPL